MNIHIFRCEFKDLGESNVNLNQNRFKNRSKWWAVSLLIAIGLVMFVLCRVENSFSAQLGFAAMSIVSMILALYLIAES